MMLLEPFGAAKAARSHVLRIRLDGRNLIIGNFYR